MKAYDIYDLPSTTESDNIADLKGFYSNHLPEIETLERWSDLRSDKFQLKTVKYFNFDGRRYWELRTAWWKGRPFMILQNAGREGDDHYARFITDEHVFNDFLEFVHSLMLPRIEVKITDPDEDLKDLTNFYGYNLDSRFQKESW